MPNGSIRRLAARSLSLLAGAVLMLSATAAQAAPAIPDYHLAVGFDLEQQSLHGIVRLTVPGGQGMHIAMDGMEIIAIELDGSALARPQEATLALSPASEAHRLTIHYRKSFAGSPDNLVSPQGIALTGLWHPRPDVDCRYRLQASLPQGFAGVSEADRIDTEITAGGSTHRFTLDQPLPGLTLVAGPYVVAEESFGNGKTLYSYFFAEDAELAASYRQKARAYLERYEAQIGSYPYQRFSIVENRLPTGYAMAGFTLLGQSVARLPFITETSLGHEVLHSWFGNAVRVDHSQGNWCEGLTTYLADQAYAADKGEAPAFRKGELLKYQHYVKADSTIAANSFHGAGPGRELSQLAERAVGYGKVAMIFRMLEQKIGADRFNVGLRRFYQTMNGRAATWEDMKQAFAPDQNELNDFFSQWLDRTDLPNLSADKITLDEKDGVLTLTFNLHQSNEKPYALEVPVAVQSSSGILRTVVSTSTTDHEVSLPLAQHPAALLLDPDYDLMRALTAKELPPSWDWFQGSNKKIAVINSSGEYDRYQPLIDELERMGTEIVAANEVEDAELRDNAVIFLGTSGPAPRGLFASPDHPATGLTIDIRTNPLNPLAPMVLASANSQSEVAAGLAKLRHYGPYGFLHFSGGRAVAKEKREAAMGIGYGLEEEPSAIATPAAFGFAEVVSQLAGKKAIYVGESHTRYEDHKLQLRVVRDLHHQGKKLAIGMEMFPHAAQPALDAFIAGTINEIEFLKQSKYFTVWSFDYRLYREILNFARANKIPVIALNIDKDKVSKVYQQGGVSGLNPEEAATLPMDRDLDIPGYRDRIHGVYTLHPGREEKQFAGFFQSQSIWDEVMAQTIADFLSSHPDRQMVVLAGNGHVLKDTGIPPRVARRKDVTQAVVMSSDGSAIAAPEADFLVFMPPAALPAQALMGVVLAKGKEDGQVLIEEVAAESPALKAGLKRGDIIISLNGQPMGTPDDVKIILVDKKKGDTVKAAIKRPRQIFADQELAVDVTL